MRRGRDLEAVMAIALIDLALQSDVARQKCSSFVAEQKHKYHAEDHDRLCRIEATRGDMETF